MIIDSHEKYDVSPERFEKQSAKDPKIAWEEKLCQLLSIYKVRDADGAKIAAEKMKAAGIDGELIRVAME